jgi:cyclophilin family peptidyl-prolyl cis-trans isomerase/HEAT repeat protein
VVRAWILIFLAFSASLLARPSLRKLASLVWGDDGHRLRRILEIEDQRSADKFLLSSLASPSKRVIRAAALAIGRIGDPFALDDLARLLNKKDRESKELAAFSLGLIGGDTAFKLLSQQTQMIKDPDSMAAIIAAAGRAGGENAIPFFSSLILKPDNPPAVADAANRGFGILLSGSSEKWSVPSELLSKLMELSRRGDDAGFSAAFALSRFKGPLTDLNVQELADAVSRAPDPSGRALLCRTLGKIRSILASTILLKELNGDSSAAVRSECAGGLGNQEINETLLSIERKHLQDNSNWVVISLLESIAEQGIGAVSLADSVFGLVNSSPSTWVRGTALKALTRIKPDQARAKTLEILNNPKAPIFTSAVGALGLLGEDQDIDKLANYVGSQDMKIAVAAADIASTLPEEKISSKLKTELKKVLFTGDAGLATLISEIAHRYKWIDFVPPLITCYRKLHARDTLEGKVAILNALGILGGETVIPVLQSALGDPEKLVVEAAVIGLKNSGTPGYNQSSIPLNSRPSRVLPSALEIRSAQGVAVRLKTNRGDIHMRMIDVAPITAENFVHLVRQGFYNGKTFHRVVPNFVIQGGDPRADGYGGPGYFIRDEVSSLKHERGMVGMATAGKDTGGSQFFIDTAPNFHLDGKYTIFAKVFRGMEVADKIDVGDVIISANVE